MDVTITSENNDEIHAQYKREIIPVKDPDKAGFFSLVPFIGSIHSFDLGGRVDEGWMKDR